MLGDFSSAKVHNRLAIQLKLVFLQGLPDTFAPSQSRPYPCVPPSIGCIQLRQVTAISLGLVHSLVGAGEQLRSGRAVIRVQGYPYADRDSDWLPSQRKSVMADQLHQAFSDFPGMVSIGAEQQDGKLVAAQAPYYIGVPQAVF